MSNLHVQAALGIGGADGRGGMQPEFLLTVLQQIVSGMIYLHQVEGKEIK